MQCLTQYPPTKHTDSLLCARHRREQKGLTYGPQTQVPSEGTGGRSGIECVVIDRAPERLAAYSERYAVKPWWRSRSVCGAMGSHLGVQTEASGKNPTGFSRRVNTARKELRLGPSAGVRGTNDPGAYSSAMFPFTLRRLEESVDGGHW